MGAATMYVEAFVDCEEWRWRVYTSDPGLIHIEYQEWNDETKRFVPVTPIDDVSFGAEYADLLCDAIQRVKSTCPV